MASGGAGMSVSVYMAHSLEVLNFFMSPKEGASELSNQLPQSGVGQKGGGKGKARKLSAIKQQKWYLTLYYKRVGKSCTYISERPILVFKVCLLIGNVGILFYVNDPFICVKNHA